MLKSLTQNEIAEHFSFIYEKCFKKKAPKVAPPVVLIKTDGDLMIGFSAGYWMNGDTFYVSSTGMVPALRTKKRAAALNKEVNEVYKKMGAKYLTGHIANTNRRAIFTALLSGYKIVGTRHSSDGNLYVIITQKL